MAQGIDGNWYGYFADKTDVATVDLIADNIDFGTAQDIARGLSGATSSVLTTYDTTTYTLITKATATLGGSGVVDNPPTLSNYNSTGGDTVGTCDQCGQIGITKTHWPFIQTFDFTQGDFDIKLEQAGADEVVTLDHNNDDLDDYSSLTLDRNSATQDAQVMLFIVDQQLNIDPTDEEVVIFKVPHDGSATGAGVSFTNGTINASLTNGVAAPAAAEMVLAGSGFGFGDNGKLLINNNTAGATVNVLEKDATIDDTVTNVEAGFMYLVFYEDADNTGTFSNVDDADDANLEVKSLAKRGTTATFDYNDSAQSFTVANDFGTIDMDESSVGDEWNSGENLVVTLIDQDLNKNTLNDEDMTIKTHNSTVPAMIIGSPITLSNESVIGEFNDMSNMTVSAFNKIGTISEANSITGKNGGSISVTFNGTTIDDYRTASLAADFVFVNYNVTQVVNTVTGVALAFHDGSALVAAESTTDTAGLLQLTNTIATAGTAAEEAKVLVLNFTGATDGMDAAIGETLFVDIFTFGDKTGYDRQNNAIYRLLL
jgi:hypothetical protein